MFKRSLLSVVLVSALAAPAMHASSNDAPSYWNRFKGACTDNFVTNGFVSAWDGYCDSTPGGFINGMLSPARYARACKDMYKAGFFKALPTAWKKHKPVLAGTALVTAAAAYAIYNDWHKKAWSTCKETLNEWKERWNKLNS